MTFECLTCGTVYDADLRVNAVCPSCQRGRTREQIEIDVLMAAATIGPFRQRCRTALTVEDFTFADHQVLFRALQGDDPDPTAVDEWIARVLDCSVAVAQKRRLDASPGTYDQDLRWLVRKRVAA